MISILFVCMGNICRSPTARGVFDALLEKHGLTDKVKTDSAGTGAWHVGKAPDSRAREAAKARGYDLDKYRARQVTEADFEKFDLVLAMDKDNLVHLNKICPAEHQDKLKLLLSYSAATDDLEVPDPYYGGKRGFELVLDLVEDACEGLLNHIRKKYAV